MLGTITLGQAPRDDIASMLRQHLPAHVQCIQAGVLDGLSLSEVRQSYSPDIDDPQLVTRMLDGSAVVLGKSKVLPLIQTLIRSLRSRGCTCILLLCTGEFEGLHCENAWLIEPDRLVAPCVAAIAGRRQVGILFPLESQMHREGDKWSVLQKRPLCEAVSPYEPEIELLERAASALRERGAELLVMDCMGYGEAHREAASRASGLPVILSNSVVSRMTAELLS
ncbi:hypothetical protein CDN99_19575 [Roseateles aquatilis]|uniref:AroM protein n=2 Tax=Roseateles aquatilis TaxID=431061 RepID=A0A246J2U1_9BURK|nr:hypothetical protein CDN99_19575 [Roseateles aquatilis]